MGAEQIRAFPFVDYVISGEADDAFPALLRHLSRGERPLHLPGVVARTPLGVLNGGPAQPVNDLDRLPAPRYAPYFQRVAELGLAPRYAPTWTLPFESARGCWWGQKHHCTFCGLNGENIGYRAKSPAHVLAELSELADAYNICDFTAVDNILPMKYIHRVFGEIEQAKLDYRFFYEVKANLTRDQIRRMYYGGVRRVQPGIESLNTNVLQLMRKGSTMLENVRCLKWCRYYRIRVAWNLIWGFPGETSEDYEAELEVLRSISHLEPPESMGRIWLERFSPLYTDPAFPVRGKRPESSYRYVYPAHVNLDRLAYFFEYDIAGTAADAAHVPSLEFVAEWRENRQAGQPDVLSYRRTADAILIDEKRHPEPPGTYRITGQNALMYEFCTDTIRTPGTVAEHLRQVSPDGAPWSVDDVRGALDEFCRKRLMLSEDDRYLGLALPASPSW
jgi:ribosomal peptide maturation radical SAM protein 1